jgi:hypothetical protein
MIAEEFYFNIKTEPTLDKDHIHRVWIYLTKAYEIDIAHVKDQYD